MSINSNSLNGQGRIRTARFTASSTWTAPAGVFAISLLGVGGGGAGGGASGNLQPTARGGGGGGGGVFDGIVPVVPGTSYTVTIGSGGVSATASNLPSGNGGDTSFGTLITCPGGQAGVSIAAGTTTSVAQTTVSVTNNPGGSFGGFAMWENDNNTQFGQGSHGGGAGSPAEFAYINSVQTTAASIRGTNLIANYNNGFQIVGLPYASVDTSLATAEGTAANSVSIFHNTQTSVTNLFYIKRNRAQSILMADAVSRPGISWKGLGAGGAGYWDGRKAASGTRRAGEWNLVEPNAGYNLGTGVATGLFSNGGANYSGAAASANSGAGGGGAYSQNTTFAPAGNGGSGYLEITWQE